MGRVSMPILNKSGYSMYWGSMWDDKLNYSRSLSDDIFLKSFIYYLFEGESKFFFLNLKAFENNFQFFKKKYSFQTKKIYKKNDIGVILNYKFVIKRKNNFRPYLSKIWLFKYQSWIIIYFYSYSFNLSSFFLKKKKKFKINNKYINILIKYYYTVLKIKNDFNFNKNFKKSFMF